MSIIQKYAPSSHKIKALIYGASGVGKTSFGATAPKPIFASAEGGLLSTATRGEEIAFAHIQRLEDLKMLYNELKYKEHNYETLIIDSITEINEIIKDKVEEEKKRSIQLQDWAIVSKEIRKILREFRELPMHVIFLAQEKTEKEDEKIHKTIPMLNGKSATEIAYNVDIVGYMYVNNKGERRIMTSAHNKFLSKDRSNKISDDIDVNFSVWVSKISEIKVGVIKDKVDAKNMSQIKEIYAEFIRISGKKLDPNVSTAIQSLFMKNDISLLTQNEAKRFIERFKKNIEEILKKECKEEVIDTKEVEEIMNSEEKK